MSRLLKIFLFLTSTVIIIFIFVSLSRVDFESKTTTSSVSSSSSALSSSSTSSLSEAGLQVTTIKEGSGTRTVIAGDSIDINYLGTLENGTKFDSSYDRGTPFSTQIGVGQVIPGWDKGVIGMKVGEKRKLVIPPALGYGARGQGTIPPNATLIFEVELMAIK